MSDTHSRWAQCQDDLEEVKTKPQSDVRCFCEEKSAPIDEAINEDGKNTTVYSGKLFSPSKDWVSCTFIKLTMSGIGYQNFIHN